jgi:hypothetical protein
MRIRPVFILVPLITIAIAAWWLLTREILMLQPLRGNMFNVLRISLFLAPAYIPFIIWRESQY